MVSRCSGDNSALFWRHICSPSPTMIHDSSMVIGLQSNRLNCCTLWIVWLHTAVSFCKKCNASRIYILLSRKNTTWNSVYLPGLGLELGFLYVETEAKERREGWTCVILTAPSPHQLYFLLNTNKRFKAHYIFRVLCVWHLSFKSNSGLCLFHFAKKNKKGRHNNMLHVYVSSLWKHLHHAMDSALCI